MSQLKVKIGDGAKEGTKRGVVQLIGVRQFPLSFYEDEWRKIASVMPGIVKFLDENKDNEHLKAAREAKAFRSGTTSTGTTKVLG